MVDATVVVLLSKRKEAPSNLHEASTALTACPPPDGPAALPPRRAGRRASGRCCRAGVG